MVLLLIVGIAIPLGTLYSFAAAPPSALGTIDSSDPSSAGMGPADGDTLDADTLVETVIRLVNWFAWFITLASVVMGLYAGFLFITARGEAAQLKTARATLVWAVIGVAVAVLSFSIIILTTTILGL